jgi:hypothetical protein
VLVLKVTAKTPFGEVLEFEARNPIEAWDVVASVAEVFLKEPCGKCGSEDVHRILRKVQDYTFRELVCSDCGAVLGLGERKDGSAIFPRRFGADGKPLPNRGWGEPAREAGGNVTGGGASAPAPAAARAAAGGGKTPTEALLEAVSRADRARLANQYGAPAVLKVVKKLQDAGAAITVQAIEAALTGAEYDPFGVLDSEDDPFRDE